MSSSLHPMLNVAIKAARTAGTIINRAALDIESVRVSAKQTNDFVTEVDVAAEFAFALAGLFGPNAVVGVSGEQRVDDRVLGGADHIWIIDPLDGTTNFIHGLPVYCVSIALMVKGKLDQAVIYDPSRNDLFYASKGRGAYLNERRIRVAKRTQLSECLVSTGFPFRANDAFNNYLQILGDVMPRCAGVRRPGSAALDLAYVAAGYTDAYFEMGLSPWDCAAGALLVTEAGGLVGNFSGDSDFLEQKECLAGNPRIYGQMVSLIGKHSKFASAGDKAAVRQAVAPAADNASDV